jgi:protein-S-isoprenylcysteine O-methyltransferase Ste14
MLNLYLFIVVCIVIWIVNGRWLIESIKRQVTSEIYTHIGLGTFLTLLALELTMGMQGSWPHFNVKWLGIIGWILYLPAAFFVFGAIANLQHKGKPAGEMTETTRIVTTGIYGLIRQPITLGMFIWSVALILVFQSLVSIIFCLPSALCFWIAARKDTANNIKKFGVDYEEYMRKVPMWNFFKGL